MDAFVRALELEYEVYKRERLTKGRNRRPKSTHGVMRRQYIFILLVVATAILTSPAALSLKDSSKPVTRIATSKNAKAKKSTKHRRHHHTPHRYTVPVHVSAKARQNKEKQVNQEARILKVLQSIKGNGINPGIDDSLFESGLLDSFALTDFVCGLEEEFGITIPDSDLSARKFDTIRKVFSYVTARAS
jgi:acyl carrier protein